MATEGARASWSDANVAFDRDGSPRKPRVLSGDRIRDRVLARVVERVISQAQKPRGPRLDEVVYETLYAEQSRLDGAEEDPRTDADRAFVAWLRREVARAGEGRYRELVHAIV